MIRLILTTIIKNIVAMMLTEKMIIWALELATKQTKNSIDDNIVAIVKAGYKNDAESLVIAVERLSNDVKKNF